MMTLLKHMLEEFELNGNERRDFVNNLVGMGKRPDEEIKWKRSRLEVYKAGCERFILMGALLHRAREELKVLVGDESVTFKQLVDDIDKALR